MTGRSADGDGPSPTLDRHVGWRLEAARIRADMTTQAVAAAIGASHDRYAAAEKGNVRLSPPEMVACADLLMVPITYFFSEFSGDDVGAADKEPIERRDNVVALPMARIGRK